MANIEVLGTGRLGEDDVDRPLVRLWLVALGTAGVTGLATGYLTALERVDGGARPSTNAPGTAPSGTANARPATPAVVPAEVTGGRGAPTAQQRAPAPRNTPQPSSGSPAPADSSPLPEPAPATPAPSTPQPTTPPGGDTTPEPSPPPPTPDPEVTPEPSATPTDPPEDTPPTTEA